MSKHKSRRSKLAEYQILREQAQNRAAANAVHIQLESLTQNGLDQVIKRAFAKAQKSEGGAIARP
jgi:hypothetical protein